MLKLRYLGTLDSLEGSRVYFKKINIKLAFTANNTILLGTS